MASKNFILVSLEENKAKQLAQAVSNDACRNILNYLADKEKGATETEISKELGLPLSTAHYNLRQLLESGIVNAENFHYSQKGREVLHYSLANKYIIIAPKATESLANKLKKILPVFAITTTTGIALHLITKFNRGVDTRLYEATQQAAEAAIAGKAATATLPSAAAEPGIALWFTIGAAFALTTYLLYTAINERRNKK